MSDRLGTRLRLVAILMRYETSAVINYPPTPNFFLSYGFCATQHRDSVTQKRPRH